MRLLQGSDFPGRRWLRDIKRMVWEGVCTRSLSDLWTAGGGGARALMGTHPPQCPWLFLPISTSNGSFKKLCRVTKRVNFQAFQFSED